MDRGDTLGVFQFASNLAIPIIRKISPKNIEELAAANSLIRPGTSGLDEYCVAKKDASKIKLYGDERLDKHLTKTFGSIVFQEQIMFLISELMDITFGQADLYRRALEKPHKDKKGYVKNFNDNVVEIAKKKGFDPEITEKVRKDIIDNSGYAFNKCLSGREKIYRDENTDFCPTIEEMYKIKNDKDYAKSIGKLSLYEEYQKGYGTTLSMNDDGELIKNNIVDITYSGQKDVYLVKTKSGEKVMCTMNHKFPTPNGKKLLSELKLGDELYIKAEHDKDLLVDKSKIVSIEFVKKESTYNIEMANPFHNLLMNDRIIVCNSHAVAYSIISYWTAWIKTNYPLVFFCNMLNDEDQFSNFLSAAEKFGITIKSPDVNKSSNVCTIENKDEKIIRIGLNMVKGVGPAAMDSIMSNKPFNSIDEFFELNNLKAVNKKVIEALIKIGALSSIGVKIEDGDIPEEYLGKIKIESENDSKYLILNRTQLSEWYSRYVEITSAKTINRYAVPANMIKGKFINKYSLIIEKDECVVIPEDKLGDMDLELEDVYIYKNNRRKMSSFVKNEVNSGNKKVSNFRKPIINFTSNILSLEEDEKEMYIEEIQELGFSFFPHPLVKNSKGIRKFEDISDGDELVTGGIVMELIERTTKTNKRFYWLNIKTPHETLRITLWNNQYIKYRDQIQKFGLVKVKGIKGFGGISCLKLAKI